jgi:alkylated DNA repair dioxygenase AlkB
VKETSAALLYYVSRTIFAGKTLSMETLFPLEPLYPAGFSYMEAFIDAREEEQLLGIIASLDLQNMQFQGYEAKRKVASFGHDWNFTTRQLSPGKMIPKEFNWLTEKVAKELLIPVESIVELLVTEYPGGAVINWHRDAPPFDIIAGISLSTYCIFKLRPYDKAKQNRKAIISLRVSPRSLYVMRGESRSDWEHSTAPVTAVRYSITLRTLREKG